MGLIVSEINVMRKTKGYENIKKLFVFLHCSSTGTVFLPLICQEIMQLKSVKK